MSLLFVICFDVSDSKRLRKVSTELENFGARVQHSVFECHLNPKQLSALKQKLAKIINPEADRIHYFSLCAKDEKRIQIDGGCYQSQQRDYHLL